jgi:hypothetical protein
MTPTLKAFAARLQELQGARLSITFADGSPPTAIIPAKHPDVGDMTIYDDGDELTIEIGHKHHTHISAYNYGSYAEEERLAMVARAAADFADDVMRDRVCITVEFKGERCIGSSHFYVNESNASSSMVRGIGVDAMTSESRSERFFWSGTIP